MRPTSSEGYTGIYHPSLEDGQMAINTWNESETKRARQYWEEYQRQHDVSDEQSQTAGIDPVSGRIWFGASAKEIVAQMETAGVAIPLYFVRVGIDYYLRKGGHRC